MRGQSPVTDNLYAKKLADVIQEVYIYQTGPIGGLICEEMFEKWASGQQRQNFNLLPQYIDMLLEELPDDKQKQAFIEGLKEEEAIINIPAISQYLDTF